MTPETFRRLAYDELAKTAENSLTAEFVRQALKLNAQKHADNNRNRPIADAATAIQAAAQHANFLMTQLETSWLWSLLTTPPPQKH